MHKRRGTWRAAVQGALALLTCAVAQAQTSDADLRACLKWPPRERIGIHAEMAPERGPDLGVGNTVLEMDFTAPGTEPQIRVLYNSVNRTTREAVVDYARQYRLPCLADGRDFKHRQVFNFNWTERAQPQFLRSASLQSLLAADGSIDAEHFPGFARLAAQSTWYPNTTASHESTEYALPMIMTGLRPAQDELLPTAADHPRSVFSMLSDSHRMRTWETFTSVCPASVNDRGAAAVGADALGGVGARLGSLALDSASPTASWYLAPYTSRSAVSSASTTWSPFVNWAPFAGRLRSANATEPVCSGTRKSSAVNGHSSAARSSASSTASVSWYAVAPAATPANGAAGFFPCVLGSAAVPPFSPRPLPLTTGVLVSATLSGGRTASACSVAVAAASGAGAILDIGVE